MGRILISAVVISLLIFVSCNKECNCEKNEMDYLIFGHFNGECIGEDCIEIFKLTSDKLMEDSNDNYPGQQNYNGNFSDLGSSKYELVKDLPDYFPAELWNEDNKAFGCPDCADQGGLYIEYSKNGIIKHWTIDQSKNEVPEYLYSFMDEVNKKIGLINN